jgi:hypothetical protein
LIVFISSVPSLNQPVLRLPIALEIPPEHDFDGSDAATGGIEELTGRLSDPSQRGGVGGLTEQPAKAAATAAAGATTRAMASKAACRVTVGAMARKAACMFM